MKPSPMRQISRVESNRALGWQVRYEREDFVCYKFFSDAQHGGKRKALLRAKQLRDSLELIAPKSKRGGIRKVKSGTVKRTRVRYLDHNGKRRSYEAYVAFLRVGPNHAAHTQASIDKWGVRRAKLMVLDWLRQKQKQQQANYRRFGLRVT